MKGTRKRVRTIMLEQMQREIDWQLDQEPFRRLVDSIINEAKVTNKVIALPLGIHPGQTALDLMTLLLCQVNCDDCHVPCCRENPGGLPISILPPEYERLAAKYDVGELKQSDDGTYELPTPCPFLKGNRCSIYSDRPLVCVIYPYQLGGEDGEGNMVLALSSSCPDARRISRLVYMFAWRIRRQFFMLGGEDFMRGILR